MTPEFPEHRLARKPINQLINQLQSINQSHVFYHEIRCRNTCSAKFWQSGTISKFKQPRTGSIFGWVTDRELLGEWHQKLNKDFTGRFLDGWLPIDYEPVKWCKHNSVRVKLFLNYKWRSIYQMNPRISRLLLSTCHIIQCWLR